MSKINQEDLSAFMDGELQDGSSRMIDLLTDDEASRHTWMRYHLIAETMRHSLPSHLDRRLARSVSTRLQAEPTILNPGRKKLTSYLKPVAGLAVAASVASVAIIGIQQQQRQDTVPIPQESRVATIQPQIPAYRQMRTPVRPASIDNTRTATINRVSPAPTATPRTNRLNSRLNNYLINYNEYHANSGMQGMLPYVRIVAHDKYKNE